MTASPDGSITSPVVRPGVRVLLIDTADRVLLFASVGDDGNRFWFPPGGASEPGETAEETARREILEETGLTELVLGGELGRRRHVVSWMGVTYDFRERWFFSRVAPFLPDTSGFSDDERAAIREHRWWTLAELATAADRMVPANLAELVRDMLSNGPPARPMEIGI